MFLLFAVTMLRAYKLFSTMSLSCFLTGRRKESPVWKFYALCIIYNLVNPCAWWPLANLTMTSTLSRPTLQWEDETARERPGYLPSYAEAKKMKSQFLLVFILVGTLEG